MKNIKIHLLTVIGIISIVSIQYRVVQAQTACNAIYANEMALALNDLRDQLDSRNDLEARRYMSLLKQQRDIEQQIQQFEQLIFRNNINSIISQLQVPLNNYINCQTALVQSLSQTTPTTLITANTCDAQYQQDMAQVMATGTSVANVISQAQASRSETIDFGQAAQNYMIALKLQRDINQQIVGLETNRFNSDLVARMRIPLNRYNDCYTTYFTNTTLVRTPLTTNINVSRGY